MPRYHDEEWGTPTHDDRLHFEYLILDANQAGLSWLTVLHKRDAFRRAYAGFDYRKGAKFGAKDVRRLMADKGIIRNRQNPFGDRQRQGAHGRAEGIRDVRRLRLALRRRPDDRAQAERTFEYRCGVEGGGGDEQGHEETARRSFSSSRFSPTAARPRRPRSTPSTTLRRTASRSIGRTPKGGKRRRCSASSTTNAPTPGSRSTATRSIRPRPRTRCARTASSSPAAASRSRRAASPSATTVLRGSRSRTRPIA